LKVRRKFGHIERTKAKAKAKARTEAKEAEKTIE
jgi:hypothetical protein